jgi:predicted protein tyrosine phosphatase
MSESSQRLKVLFVCNQNKVRSLTAEHLYRVRPDLEVRSAGTATFAKKQITAELLEWADQVFVFDETQMEAIASRFPDVPLARDIVCLGLPDTFEYKSPRLIVKLTAKLEPYLGRPTPKPGRKSLPPKRPAPRETAKRGAAAPPIKSLVSQLLTAVGVGSRKRSAAK